LRRPLPDRGGTGGVPSLRHRAYVAMQIHFNDASHSNQLQASYENGTKTTLRVRN